MSTPSNPLAKYRSYSYYHVLLICDSSETAEAVSSSTEVDNWLHTKPSSGQLQDEIAIQTASNGGNYCILINGATDAGLVITNVKIVSATAASATQNDKNTSIAIEGSLKVSEPRGVMLMSYIIESCKNMGIDASSAVWCLKTFFVGYQDDDNITYIADIAPVMFIVYDVIGSFTERGGEYEISFASLSHGISRLPQFSKLPVAMNFSSGSTLKDAIANLQKIIDENYQHYYDCVVSQVKNIPNSEELIKTFRRVKYKIELDPIYEDPSYKVDDLPAQLKNQPACATKDNAQHNPPDVSIEDAIHNLMDRSKKVKTDSAVGEKGIKYIHKVLTSLPTTISKQEGTDGNAIDTTVTYKIVRTFEPHSISFEDVVNGNLPNAAENLITFDYIYTGKNIDILEMDIKLNLGYAYLQTATLKNSYPTTGDVATCATVVSNRDLANGVCSRQGQNVNNVPIYFGTTIKNPNVGNTQTPASSGQHAYTLSKHASLEMAESTIKIMGNPNLLNSVMKNTSPTTVNNLTSISANSQPVSSNTGNEVMPNWSIIPSFAKVNIKMPRHNDDLSLFSPDGSINYQTSTDYATDFWFKGYYYIYGIEHYFDEGEFTQVLSMLAIPEKNTFQTQADVENAETPNITELVDSCFNNKMPPCSPSQGKSPVALPEPSSNMKSAFPNNSTDNLHDSVVSNSGPYAGMSINGGVKSDIPLISDSLPTIPEKDANWLNNNAKTTSNLSDIAGYDKASPEVKAAITKASKETGMDEFTLAQFISMESKFNTSAVSSTGCTGLGQFSKGTWKQYGGGADRTDANANALATARYMSDNQSYLTKKLGRPPTVGELYMAHNQGPGGAVLIHNACEKGGSAETLPPKIRKNIAAQGGGLNQNTNPCDVKAWMENFMAKGLTKNAPHVPHNVPVNSKTVDKTSAEARTAKLAYAASRDCKNEEAVKNNQEKQLNCNEENKAEQTDKSSSSGNQSTSSNQSYAVSNGTGSVPQIAKDGSVIMDDQVVHKKK